MPRASLVAAVRTVGSWLRDGIRLLSWDLALNQPCRWSCAPAPAVLFRAELVLALLAAIALIIPVTAYVVAVMPILHLVLASGCQQRTSQAIRLACSASPKPRTVPPPNMPHRMSPIGTNFVPCRRAWMSRKGAKGGARSRAESCR